MHLIWMYIYMAAKMADVNKGHFLMPRTPYTLGLYIVLCGLVYLDGRLTFVFEHLISHVIGNV